MYINENKFQWETLRYFFQPSDMVYLHRRTAFLCNSRRSFKTTFFPKKPLQHTKSPFHFLTFPYTPHSTGAGSKFIWYIFSRQQKYIILKYFVLLLSPTSSSTHTTKQKTKITCTYYNWPCSTLHATKPNQIALKCAFYRTRVSRRFRRRYEGFAKLWRLLPPFHSTQISIPYHTW